LRCSRRCMMLNSWRQLISRADCCTGSLPEAANPPNQAAISGVSKATSQTPASSASQADTNCAAGSNSVSSQSQVVVVMDVSQSAHFEVAPPLGVELPATYTMPFEEAVHMEQGITCMRGH
jgi:hypothetical protein